VGEVDGTVDVRGVNGRVQIAETNGSAEFKGVNGNISVGLKQLNPEGVTLGGINGNIELQVSQDLNADFDGNGINGNVATELSNVLIDKSKHGRFSDELAMAVRRSPQRESTAISESHVVPGLRRASRRAKKRTQRRIKGSTDYTD
jgi:hypothetical protein